MKKLLVFPGYFTPHVGGLESHVDELAKRLSNKGFDITIFAPNLPKNMEYEKINGNLRIIRYPSFEIITNFPMPKLWRREFWRRLSEFKSERYDFVMSRTRFFFSSFIACRFAKKNNIRFVHVEHGSDYVKLSNPITTAIAWAYDQTLGRYVIKKADICIAISQGSKEFLRRFRKKGEIPVITRGIEFEYIDAIKKDKKISEKYENKLIIGYAGRIIKWKGLKNALEGYRMIDEKTRQKTVFLIVGEGPDFQKLKKEHESENIIFLGKKPREEAISIIKTFDIYVHSTISGGGISNSLLEAMTAGKAIIATKAEGAGEILDKESAILIEKSEPELFRKAFVRLIEDRKLKKRMEENAQNDVRKNFRWEEKINLYLKVLE